MRRLAGTLAAATLVTLGPTSTSSAATEPPLVPVPRPICEPGSVPEPGLQGRVPQATPTGYRCNVDVVGRSGITGGYKVERYVDRAGRECAYYDTTLLFPTNAGQLVDGPTGVAVLDMTDPTKPVRTATLSTPAMQTPHESLLVNQPRGLVAAVAGNPIFGPGQVDVYDASADCRNPVLRSTLPVGLLGHESGFSPDGRTFWAASLGANVLTAVDLTDPARPRVAYTGAWATHGVNISADGNRAYLAAGAGFPRNEVGLPAPTDGLVILDVSQVQARQPNPQVRQVSALTWPSVTIPQAAIPVTIGGRPYLVEVDEFAYNGNRIAGNGARVGAARIIDLADETKPRVVSNLRLQVHQEQVRPQLAQDPGATSATGGYAGHYCNVPQRIDPQIVACSFLASGLRVFDIRDPLAPREVAYFVRPTTASPNNALASPAFVPERREVWYSDGDTGFWALRLSASAWPGAGPATAGMQPAEAPPAAAPAPAAPAVAVPRRVLAATGPALPMGAGLLVLAVAIALRRRHP